jgi:hypothetical protein
MRLRIVLVGIVLLAAVLSLTAQGPVGMSASVCRLHRINPPRQRGNPSTLMSMS